MILYWTGCRLYATLGAGNATVHDRHQKLFAVVLLDHYVGSRISGIGWITIAVRPCQIRVDVSLLLLRSPWEKRIFFTGLVAATAARRPVVRRYRCGFRNRRRSPAVPPPSPQQKRRRDDYRWRGRYRSEHYHAGRCGVFAAAIRRIAPPIVVVVVATAAQHYPPFCAHVIILVCDIIICYQLK